MADKVTFKKDAPRWASQAKEENMSQLADDVAKRVLAERERRLRKSNLTSSPSETPRANVGSANRSSSSSSTSKRIRSSNRKRSEVGRRKIEDIARELMKKEPEKFRTFAQAVAHVTRQDPEAAKIFREYCTGPNAQLTETQHVEKSQRLTPTQMILKGIEAIPMDNLTFSEKLAIVLKTWPSLARLWHQG